MSGENTMPAAALYALQVLQLLPMLIGAGQGIMGLVNQATTAMQSMIAEMRGPTQAEWDVLNAITAGLRTQLHAPKT